MPEVMVRLRWPDGAQQDIYSPSLVVTERLQEGRDYPVAELVSTLNSALEVAGARVQAKHGFACGRAAASIVSVQAKAALWSGDPSAVTTVEAFIR